MRSISIVYRSIRLQLTHNQTVARHDFVTNYARRTAPNTPIVNQNVYLIDRLHKEVFTSNLNQMQGRKHAMLFTPAQ